MNAVYAKVLEMSLYGSIAILIVLLFRLIFRRLPKRVLIVFWMIVAVRLLLPVNFASPTSVLNVSRLFRSGGEKTEAVSVEKNSDEEGGAVSVNTGNAGADTAAASDASGAGAFADEMDVEAENGGAEKPGAGDENKAETAAIEEEPARLNSKQAQAFRVIAFVWLLVIVGLIVLFGVRYVIFYSKARWSSRSYDGSYFTTDIKSPFVIGFVNPKIFIPKHFDEDEKEYILNHEWTHIKNKDGIIKLISYAVLCIHWFNPLVWLAFVMLCADIEMRVDEETTDSFDMDMVKEYCMSLVKHAAADSGGTFLESTAFSGLGFGGMETKLRIKNLLNNRKVSKFMPVLAIIITFSVVFFASSRSFGSPAEDYFAKLGRSPAEAEVTEKITEESTSETVDSTESTEETTPSETPSETEEPSESTAPLSDYAQAYIKLIEDLQTDSREAKLTLIHVDGDDIPELLMTEPKADQKGAYCIYLYTFRDGREQLVLSSVAGEGAHVYFFCYQPYQDAICQYRRPQIDDPASPYLVERKTMDNFIRGANGIDIDYTKDTPNWLMMGYEDDDTVIGYLKSGNIPMDNKYEKHPQYAPFTPTPTPQPTEAPTPTPTEEPTTTTEPPEQTPTRYQPQREPIADYNLYTGQYVVNGGGEILYLFYIRGNLIEVNLWVNRTANLEQAIVEFEDNIGIFYYKGVKDENWNGVIDDGEEFYRKGTIELLPDGVKITIEDVNSNEFELSKDVSSVFAGGEYITAGTSFYPFSSRSS